MKILKQTLNYIVMLTMSVALLYLAQEFAKEVETYIPATYADTKGCPADVRWDYLECS